MNMKNRLSCCPWWNEKYGLEKYVSSENDGIVSLAFWPIMEKDEMILLSNVRNLTALNLKGCNLVTDGCLSGLALCVDDAKKFQNNCQHRLLRLDLSGCESLTDSSLKLISSFIRLESVNLSNCSKIGDGGLKYLMDGCKYLVEIHLKNLNRCQDEGMAYIIRNLAVMKLLRIMAFDGCTGFSNEVLIRLLETEPSPRNIDLSNTKIDLGFVGFRKKNMGENGCKVLRMRNLPKILDSMMQWVSAGCKDLQHLDLSGNEISDNGVNYLLHGCRKLKTIDFHNCYNLSDEAFKCLESPLLLVSCLRSINLSNNTNITSSSISKLASACKDLTKVLLMNVPKICDKGIVPLAFHCTLQELDLSARILSKPSSSCSVPRVGSQGIIAIGQNCASLRFLRVDECSRINDMSMITLARGCVHLEEISMRRCYKIGNKSLSAIGKYCHLLRRINISSCTEVTDIGIEKLAKGCLHLMDVDVSNLRLTDRGISQLGRNCRSMRSLNLQNCYSVTDESLSTLLEHCTLLEKINLKGCDLITKNSLATCYLPLLRYGAFQGTRVSEEQLTKIAAQSLYCRQIEGKCLLSPAHLVVDFHSQHKMYISFLRRNVKIIFCAIKAHQLRYRCKLRRRVKIRASTHIYNAIKFHQARKKQRRDLVILQSVEIIVARLRLLRDQRFFSRCRAAAITIQCFIRHFLAQMMGRELLTEHPSKSAKVFKVIDSALSRNNISFEYWRRFTVANIVSQTITKRIHVRRIQVGWRNRTEKVYQRQRHLHDKVYNWILSIVELHKRTVRTQLRGALIILKTLQLCRSLIIGRHIESICQLLNKKRSMKNARIEIAHILQRKWRSKLLHRLLKEKRKEQSLVMTRSAIILQTWYRRLLSVWLLRLKKDILGRWWKISKFLSQQEKSKFRRAVIELHWHHEARRRYDASLTIALGLDVLLRKQQMRKRRKKEEELKAVSWLQVWWRIKLFRIDFIKTRASAIKIQRTWKALKSRNMLLELYKLERSRIAATMAREKRSLREIRRKRKIVALFDKRRCIAAIKIQSYCREYLVEKRQKDESRLQKELEERTLAKEEARLNNILRRKQNEKKLKVITKNILSKVAGKLSRGVGNITSLQIVHRVKSQKQESDEKGKLAVELLRYDREKKVKNYSKPMPYIVSQYCHSIQQKFGEALWFDKTCEKIMIRYLLRPDQVLSLRRVWIDSFDFNQESDPTVTAIEFFDHVNQPRSEFGLWLFRAAAVDAELMSFSQYISLVAFAALLNKSDALRLMFKYSTQNSSLTKEEWKLFVETMLSIDNVHHSRRTVIEAFDRFTSRNVHGENVLHFEDFTKIINHYPFLEVSFSRLLSGVRANHLGETWWRTKRKEIQRAYATISEEDKI